MKDFTKIMRGVALLTQLGLSVAAPPVLMIWLAQWLQNRCAIGAWLTIVALVAGFISSACGLYQFYKTTLCQSERESKKHPPSFDRHD